MQSYSRDKKSLLNRLKRIEGQVKGIQRMIIEEKYCFDVLTQIAAIRAAINKVGIIMLENHTRNCLSEAINTEQQEEKLEELIKVVMKFVR